MNARNMMVGLLAVVVAVTALGHRAAAQEPNKDEVFGWYKAAEKHKSSGEYAQAIKLYEQVVREAPRVWGEGSENHAAVMNNLAELYQAIGRYAEAEPLYKRCLAIVTVRRIQVASRRDGGCDAEFEGRVDRRVRRVLLW